MHAEKLCHKWLLKVVPGVHRRRLSAVCAVVGGAFRGGKLNVTFLGRSIRGNAKAKHSIKRADRLFSNENLQREVVATHSTRMHIEESFRDLKCHRNGLDPYHNGTYKLSRMRMLVLIGAISTTFAWIYGQVARFTGVHRQFQSNTTTSVPVLSNVFIGIQIFGNTQLRIPWKLIELFHREQLICQSL